LASKTCCHLSEGQLDDPHLFGELLMRVVCLRIFVSVLVC